MVEHTVLRNLFIRREHQKKHPADTNITTTVSDERHQFSPLRHRSIDHVIIQITISEGRTVEKKQLLFKTIAESLNSQLAIRREDVFIIWWK